MAALQCGNDAANDVVVAIDGGCPGVKNVKAGIIGATSQQYPLKMAALGLEAIVNFVNLSLSRSTLRLILKLERVTCPPR